MPNIYIYLDEKNFNKNNLEKIFKAVSQQNSSPPSLIVKIFSDKNQLKSSINIDRSNAVVDFEDSEKGRESANEFYKEYFPSAKGYYRATYYRNINGSGFFDYSPEKDNPEMIRIKVKS